MFLLIPSATPLVVIYAFKEKGIRRINGIILTLGLVTDSIVLCLGLSFYVAWYKILIAIILLYVLPSISYIIIKKFNKDLKYQSTIVATLLVIF